MHSPGFGARRGSRDSTDDFGPPPGPRSPMRGAAYRLPLGVRLRGAVGAPPGRVALLVPALGLAFGFVAAVSGTAHATWFGLPSGVAAANYHTVGRRSALTGEFDRLTVADFRTLQQAVPQIEWGVRRQVACWARPAERGRGNPDHRTGSVPPFLRRARRQGGWCAP